MGSPLVGSDSPIQFCTAGGAPEDVVDTCPDQYYCLVIGGKSGSGHCCPAPKAVCPAGQPHPNATCGMVPPSGFGPGVGDTIDVLM